MMYVMKIAVYSKSNLKEHPKKVALIKGLISLGYDVSELNSLTDVADFERLLVFGGDGTMLIAGISVQCPILGVNLGNVGFLTQFEADVSLKELTRAIESQNYVYKSLLQASINGESHVALNDIVIRTTSSKPISLSLKINDQFVDKYHADGLIIATPAGSTAYSLSAGGPILSPNVDAIIINPICAHSLHSRPLIVSSDSNIEVSLEGEHSVLIADGREQIDLQNASIIQISKSQRKATFVCETSNFYNKLLEKMNRWGVTD